MHKQKNNMKKKSDYYYYLHILIFNNLCGIIHVLAFSYDFCVHHVKGSHVFER